MGSFVISYAVVSWYYTPYVNGRKGHNWFGLVWGYVYGCTVHLGTLALGSFLIALLRYLRLICMILDREAKAEGNVVMHIIAKIAMCCIECFKKFMEWVNKNAYIDVCISSSNFCSAAMHVMSFLAGNGATIAILNGACFVFSFAGMAIISLSTGYLTYMTCTSNERWTSETSPHHVESPRVLAFVSFIAALYIAHCFMQIFDHTADTLLYTFTWNKSKAHNTVQKYAPETLRNLVEYKPLTKPKAEKKSGGDAGGGGGWFSSLFGGGGSKGGGSSSERQPLMGK